MSTQPPVYVVQAPPTRMNPFVATIIGIALAIAAQWFGIPLPPAPILPPQQPPSSSPPAPPAPAPAPPVMPAPIPPVMPPPAPRTDTLAAIGRIQFGNSGCTATVIGPRRDDGRYWVLTAAHCVNGIGQNGSMRLRDGRTFGLQVVALNRTADACWCVTSTNSVEYPTALVADRSPAPGSRIWHAGYGVDVPGNREDGTVTSGPNSDGQIEMRLSVSSGDSGGGIALTEDGRIVSCVCCTTIRGATGRVWGASPEAINKLKPATVSMDTWLPLELPMCGERAK